jgi:hypothetical protein
LEKSSGSGSLQDKDKPAGVIDVAAQLGCGFIELEGFVKRQKDSLSNEIADIQSGTFGLTLNDFKLFIDAVVAAAPSRGDGQPVKLMAYVHLLDLSTLTDPENSNHITFFIDKASGTKSVVKP